VARRQPEGVVTSAPRPFANVHVFDLTRSKKSWVTRWSIASKGCSHVRIKALANRRAAS